MLLRCAPITNAWWLPTPVPVFSILFHSFTRPTHYFTSLSPCKASLCVDEECNDFLPWLERKAGREISSLLAIGTSSFGRSQKHQIWYFFLFFFESLNFSFILQIIVCIWLYRSGGLHSEGSIQCGMFAVYSALLFDDVVVVLNMGNLIYVFDSAANGPR